jgi:hypothetical protein
LDCNVKPRRGFLNFEQFFVTQITRRRSERSSSPTSTKHFRRWCWRIIVRSKSKVCLVLENVCSFNFEFCRYSSHFCFFILGIIEKMTTFRLR